MKIIRTLVLLALSGILLNSCEKEPGLEQKYLDLEFDDEWQDFEINENEKIIFKITIEKETRIDLSWKDVAAMKDTDTYTGDIVVSAFRPDGLTPYFENEDNGYQDDSRMIEIAEGDMQVILIVTSKEGKAGTFTMRSRGLNDDLQITNPKDIAFGEWHDKNCNEGDVKWLKVDCETETDVLVEWKEFDRQEAGETYSADIVVSAYSEDLDVVYIDNKNHGYEGEPRTFSLTHSSSIIYLRVSLNDETKPGSYSIKVSAQL